MRGSRLCEVEGQEKALKGPCCRHIRCHRRIKGCGMRERPGRGRRGDRIFRDPPFDCGTTLKSFCALEEISCRKQKRSPLRRTPGPRRTLGPDLRASSAALPKAYLLHRQRRKGHASEKCLRNAVHALLSTTGRHMRFSFWSSRRANDDEWRPVVHGDSASRANTRKFIIE